ncbi:CU044_5270 family protein [Streptomyces marincola]|uniref:CU044_5270 family protein n=1 Tax=Streptomyces marincola TaxID=2878388 RepID=UPI001CF22ECA|nr:CU044_5270 family protein [Streptomyces marincola]UCM88767.1 CU044_5270 family protein [Streptomyces marincola]
MIRRNRRPEDETDTSELAGLLPAPEHPELPADRRLLLQNHVMSEIRRSAPSPARRRFAVAAVPVATAATAAVIVAAVTLSGGDGGGPAVGDGSDGRGMPTLERLAAAAAAQPETEIRDDQFLYETGVVRSPDAEADGGGELHEFEMWTSADASEGWYTDPSIAPEGGVLFHGTLLLPEGGPEAGGMRDITRDCLAAPSGVGEVRECAGLPSMQAITPLRSWDGSLDADLPRDPSALLDRINDELGDHYTGETIHQHAFDRLGEFLTRPLMPPEAAETVLLALAEIPGVTVEATTDATGRAGVGVTWTGDNLYEATYILDAETGAYLGARSVVAVTGVDEVPTGRVFSEHAVTGWEVVDELPEDAAEALADWSRQLNP